MRATGPHPRAKGAEIVIIPSPIPSPTITGWPQRDLAAGQECPVYGIKSALVGKLLGFEFTGRAGIFAPAELTPGGSGVLAEVESPEEEGIALAEIDLAALQELRRDHPWRDSNPALYRRYFPRVYRVLEVGSRKSEVGGSLCLSS